MIVSGYCEEKLIGYETHSIELPGYAYGLKTIEHRRYNLSDVTRE